MWLIVSKAALRLSSMKKVIPWLSMLARISLRTLTSAVSVEWCFLKDDYLSGKRRLVIQYSINWLVNDSFLSNYSQVCNSLRQDRCQTNEIEKQQSHTVRRGNYKTSDYLEENSNGPPKLGSHKTKCCLCGGRYPHQATCPAHGKRCMSCAAVHPSILRNLTQKPKSKYCVLVDSKGPSDGEALTSATAASDSSEKHTFTTGAQDTQTAKPIFQIKRTDTPIRIMADPGATVNILSKKDFDGHFISNTIQARILYCAYEMKSTLSSAPSGEFVQDEMIREC